MTTDFSGPTETWTSLGRAYHAVARVTTWSATDPLTASVSAIFRKDDQWAVYVDRNGRARVRPVEIGHRSSRIAEVVSGLAEGTESCCIPARGSRWDEYRRVTHAGSKHPRWARASGRLSRP